MKAANDNAPIRFLSVCSGIEAASVAFGPLGWRAVAFSEIEKFPSAVLAHHYPDVPNLGDFTKIDTTILGRIDILCGGTPCQAFSVAGARRGLNDERGNLTLSFVELAHELAGSGKTAGNGLRNIIWENVVGVLSDKTNAFGCFLAGLVGADAPLVSTLKQGRWPDAGMVDGPLARAAWRIQDAQYFGLAQRRKRVIVVADFGNGADPAAVLFEPESVRRDSPPSRETGQGVAAAAKEGAKGGGRGVERTGDTRGQDPVVAVFDRQSNCEYGEQNLASTVSARDYKSPTDLVAVGVTGPISHALKAEGADASEDGTGRGTPIIAFTSINDGGDATNGMTPTLTCGGGGGQGVGMAITVALRGREGGATAELGGDVATALRASSGGGDKPHVLTYSQDHGSPIKPSEICPTLTKDGPSGSAGGNGADVLSLTSAVRRLTPRECERLQGFQFLVAPDYPKAWQDDAGRWWSPDYTAIPYNKVSEAKLDADWVKYMARGNPKNLTRADVARLAADGPRYKALGNSWAVPLFNWLGKRIASHMPALAANDNTKDSTSAAA